MLNISKSAPDLRNLMMRPPEQYCHLASRRRRNVEWCNEQRGRFVSVLSNEVEKLRTINWYPIHQAKSIPPQQPPCCTFSWLLVMWRDKICDDGHTNISAPSKFAFDILGPAIFSLLLSQNWLYGHVMSRQMYMAVARRGRFQLRVYHFKPPLPPYIVGIGMHQS